MFMYLLFGILGGIVSFFVYVFSEFAGHEAAQTEALLLSLTYAGVIIFLLTRDKPEKFAFALVLPAFIVVSMNILYAFVTNGLLRWPPDSEIFTAECSKTVVKYIKSPIMPVHSIAYDWDSEEAPSFIEYQIVDGTRIREIGQSSLPEVNDQRYDFIETKHTPSIEVQCLSDSFKYLRYPKNTGCYGAGQLTADVLVKYKTSSIEQSKNYGAIRYELTVSDRRNGDTLAYLRYVIDVKKQRACGLSGKGRVSDSQFIRKAIGF